MAKSAVKAASTSLAQRKIGTYRCTVNVATGGFGTIWKAQTSDRKKTVAVKVMNPDTAASRECRAAFEREYKLCKGFDHPNLMKVLDFGVFEDFPYMVMEFFPGENVKTMLKGDAPERARGKVREIVTGAAEALAYVHEQGAIHLDVKPENLMLDEKGRVKLIDFSNALAGMGKWLPFFRKISGTPAYMAPEQIQKKRVGPSADLYALGATLFEILAGRPPFAGDSDNDVMNQHLKSTPPKVSRFNPDASMALDKLVSQMLAKEPAMRIPDMKTFLNRFAKTELYKS